MVCSNGKMSRHHSAWRCNGISEKLSKSTKRVPRYPTGERRGAAGDRTLPLGAGTGNGRAQQRPYSSSSPPETPPGKAQAGSRRGNGSEPPSQPLVFGSRGTGQSRALCNTSLSSGQLTHFCSCSFVGSNAVPNKVATLINYRN